MIAPHRAVAIAVVGLAVALLLLVDGSIWGPVLPANPVPLPVTVLALGLVTTPALTYLLRLPQAVRGDPRAGALLTLLGGVGIVLMLAKAFGLQEETDVLRPVLSMPLSTPLDDPFHEGELIGAIGWFTGHSVEEYPILIHGPGRNLLPTYLAARLAEDPNRLVAIRFVVAMTTWATIALAVLSGLFATAALMPRRAGPILLGGSLTAFLVLVVAIPTNRDIVFFAILATALALIPASARGLGRAPWLAALLGALTVAAPLWSYGAGIQGALVALVAAGAAIVLRLSGRPLLALAGCLGAAASFAVVTLAGGTALYLGAMRDILYWSGERAIWSLPLTAPIVAFSVSLALVIGALAAITRRAAPGIGAVLIASCTAATLSYANRSDLIHVGYAVQIAAPAFAPLTVVLLRTLPPIPARLLTFAAAMPTLGAALVLPGVTLPRALADLSTPDAAILPAETQALAGMLEAPGDRPCLLGLVNEGDLNYATGLPPCGPAFYPIYLGKAGDAAFAEWIATNPQPIAISESWTRDGRPVADILPRSLAMIDRLYPQREQFGAFTIHRPAVER